MELAHYLLPTKVVEAFRDVDPKMEIEKFLLKVNELSGHEFYPHHFECEELNSFISIPEERILVGEISNISHGDENYRVFNPAWEYFVETLFGFRFDLDYINVHEFERHALDEINQTTGSRLNKFIKKVEIKTFDGDTVIVYILGYTRGQSGDPWYFALRKDDLNCLIESAFKSKNHLRDDNFSNYISARLAERVYQTNMSGRSYNVDTKIDTSEYIDDLINLRHYDEYKWWGYY